MSKSMGSTKVNHRHLAGPAAVAILLSGGAAKAQPATAPSETAPTPAEGAAPAPAPAEVRPPHVPEPAAEQGAPLAKVPVFTTNGWDATIYGFVEFDAMRDSSHSYGDYMGNGPLLRTDGSNPAFLPDPMDALKGPAYGSNHPRLIFTTRNSRMGFKIAAPEVARMKVTGVLEFDLFGNQPSSPLIGPASTTTESAYFASPTFRARHLYMKMESGAVDVLAGQYYNLFGWQPVFFPATDGFLGVPNMVFGRTPQLRVTKVIETSPINVHLAAAALRPPQADSAVPDLQAGLRFTINNWKGAHASGSGQPALDAMSIGVSAVYRRFQVVQWQNTQTVPNGLGDYRLAEQSSDATGYGVSIDASIPVIPIKDIKDRANALTLTGSLVTGTGIGDQYTGGATGGAPYPLPTGAAGLFTGSYIANVDPGLVQWAVKLDSKGNPIVDATMKETAVLRTINWTSYMIGLQYYLPFLEGRFAITGNYTHSASNNLQQTNSIGPANARFTVEKNAGGDPTRTFKEASYYDANILVDITKAFKAGLSWQHVEQVFLATGLAGLEQMKDSTEKNDRFELSTLFFF
jgi:hypothetical protein